MGLGRVNLEPDIFTPIINLRPHTPNNSPPQPIYLITMEGLFFNVNNGYIEGLVRGYRNGLLTSQNYANLTQCETLDGKLLSHATSADF